MSPCLRYIISLVLLCLLVQVGTPLPDEGKNINTRSDSGAVGDPNQANKKEQQAAADTKSGDNDKATLEDSKEQTGAAPSSTKVPISPTPTPTAVLNCTNSTDCEGVKPSLKQMFTTMVSDNKGMLTRTAYVLVGCTLIVVVYYVMRAVRLRKKSKTKKYGVISSRDADLEMRPLEEDDDEDDVTVFEVNGMNDFRSTAHR